jgi:SAM-dependent methyltransferase
MNNSNNSSYSSKRKKCFLKKNVNNNTTYTLTYTYHVYIDEYVHDFIWTNELESKAKEIINNNVTLIECAEHFNTQLKNWEKFYKFNKTNFFKDRHYILSEFQELKSDTRDKITLLDIGCGVGNSFYPLIKRLPHLHVYAFDFSKRAVNMASTHELYNTNKHRISLLPLDIVEDAIPFDACDYGILMFVLSAIAPERHKDVIMKIRDKLNKGAVLYFRDYARFDMAQLRFAERQKNKVGDNLYMRKDKTLSYFFDKKEIEELFISCGFDIVESNLICRLIENRKDNKQMHRLWLQIKFKKI